MPDDCELFKFFRETLKIHVMQTLSIIFSLILGGLLFHATNLALLRYLHTSVTEALQMGDPLAETRGYGMKFCAGLCEEVFKNPNKQPDEATPLLPLSQMPPASEGQTSLGARTSMVSVPTGAQTSLVSVQSAAGSNATYGSRVNRTSMLPTPAMRQSMVAGVPLARAGVMSDPTIGRTSLRMASPATGNIFSTLPTGPLPERENFVPQRRGSYGGPSASPFNKTDPPVGNNDIAGKSRDAPSIQIPSYLNI